MKSERENKHNLKLTDMRKLILILMTVFLCASLELSAQTRVIHGTVLDAVDNEPLVGVTVRPLGDNGNNGTSTDINGAFELRVPAGVKKAKVTYVGYSPQIVDLQDGMKIYLTSSSTDLNDVVVVAYGTTTKEALTGSVAVVGQKEIESRPVNTITTALEGNAPGVMVSSSTAAGPGGSPSILVRGLNTVNGTNAPIYVVDGVLFNGSLADINPEDVESMSVLKDAASCALYGAKGANGVILITTRKAKNTGRVEVTAKVSQGIYERGLPFYDTLNTNQWMETALLTGVNSQITLAGAEANPTEIRKSQIENFFSNNKVWNVYGNKTSQEIFNADGKVVLNPLAAYNDLDWWDSFAQTGYRQEYSLSAAASGAKHNAFASASYLKSQGYLINTDFERYSARFNFNANPVNYFRFGTNGSITYVKSDDDDIDSDNLNSTANPFVYTYRAPVFPYYDHNPANGEFILNDKGEKIYNETTGYKAYESNIAYYSRMNSNKYDRLAATLSVYGTAVLPYGFEFTVRGDMFRSKQEYKSYGNPVVGAAKGFGRLGITDYTTRTYNFQQALDWSHNYGNHHVDVLLNHENYAYDYQYNSQQAMNMVFTTGALELTNFADNETFSSYHIQRTTEAYLGRARYNYDQKYFGEFSIRRDGTSRFAKESRWGTFWSVGASWILSKENFLKDVNWIDYLKLRGSYGTAGNDAAASSYAYWDLYTQRSARVDGQLVMYPSQIGNSNAKWESVSTLDLALEGNVLNDRLNFSIGFFVKNNSDLLYNVRQPSSSGGTWSGETWTILKNIGTMRNVGWELMFKGDIIRTKDWKWSANIDASFIKNKLVKLSDSGDQWTSNIALLKGKTRYEYYTYTYAGVDLATGQGLYEINQDSHSWTKLVDGTVDTYEYDDAAWEANLAGAEKAGELVKIGDRYYTPNTAYASKHLHGTSLPTVFGSFGTQVSWKGINVSALFTYRLGGKLLDSRYNSLMTFSEGKETDYHKDILNSWTEAPANINMDDPASRISKDINPQINGQYSSYASATSSRWLTSANTLQFKNLNVSYDFPKVVTKAIRMQGLNLGMFVENLFTVTKRKGINPGYSYSGGQGDYFVVSRVFSFQLTARF